MSSLPTVETDPWERVDEWTETAFDSRFVTVEAHNAVYERPEFREQVEHLLPADIDQSMRALFTTGLSMDPSPPGSETPEKLLGVAAPYARREFRGSLTEDGLLDVEHTGSQEMRLRGRRTAKAFQYDAGYPLNGDALGTPETPVLSIRVWAAIWPTAEAFDMAGGIYPLESLTAVVDRTGAGEPGVAIEAQPGGDRREVFDRIREASE